MMLTYTSGVDSAMARAVVVSLFTWRRALPTDVLDGDDLQGWWGDSYPAVADDRIGSRLWLLRRRTLVAQTTLDAIRYAEEALAWMVEDELLVAVRVTAQRQGLSTLSMRVVGLFGDGSAELLVDFNDIWRVIQNGI